MRAHISGYVVVGTFIVFDAASYVAGSNTRGAQQINAIYIQQAVFGLCARVITLTQAFTRRARAHSNTCAER